LRSNCSLDPEEDEKQRTQRKTFGKGSGINNKVKRHVTLRSGFEHGPHWWKMSALANAPSLLPLLTQKRLFSLATESGRKRAYDLVKIKNRSCKRGHKLDGIGVGRIRMFPFLPIPFTTASLMIQ